MIKINSETYRIFQNTANPKLAERDYLECAVLNDMFQEPYFRDKFVFAGGGSITKTYKLCQRVGQDLDLSCQVFNDIPDTSSQNQLSKFKRRFKDWVFDEVKYQIANTINQDQRFMILTDRDWSALENKEQFISFPTLHLLYKSAFDTNMGHICIEMIPRIYRPGTVRYRKIVPYSIGGAIGGVPTVHYEQTFWDKIFALHEIATANIPHLHESVSRHYYDVAKISARINIAQTQHMLNDTIAYQKKYTTKHITPIETTADIKLLPGKHVLGKLESDWHELSRTSLLSPMSWNEIILTLKKLNSKIKAL